MIYLFAVRGSKIQTTGRRGTGVRLENVAGLCFFAFIAPAF